MHEDPGVQCTRRELDRLANFALSANTTLIRAPQGMLVIVALVRVSAIWLRQHACLEFISGEPHYSGTG